MTGKHLIPRNELQHYRPQPTYFDCGIKASAFFEKILPDQPRRRILRVQSQNASDWFMKNGLYEILMSVPKFFPPAQSHPSEVRYQPQVGRLRGPKVIHCIKEGVVMNMRLFERKLLSEACDPKVLG
ncbi:MAG: hypothetical protein HY650_16630 [Acidobacteria bacterium]|nr:hypothetical protein [Acidobacteriota bacterium]